MNAWYYQAKMLCNIRVGARGYVWLRVQMNQTLTVNQLPVFQNEEQVNVTIKYKTYI
jgi:exosome complex RNA-binding protein Rrp4